MSAEAVAPDASNDSVDNVHHLVPQFEGRNIEIVEAVFGGKVVLDDEHAPVLSIDDKVRVSVIYSVGDVIHTTDKEGRLVRRATLKPQEAVVIPFTPGEDDGVLRG